MNILSLFDGVKLDWKDLKKEDKKYVDINIKAAKRTAEIIQEHDQALNNLNITAALKETAIEFSERGKKVGDFKRVIRGIVC